MIDYWKQKRHDERLHTKLVSRIQRKPKRHAQAQEVHDAVFEEIDCLSCANCCKSIPPIVSQRDAKRIAKRLQISKTEFLDKYTTTDEDGDMVINASPCPFLESDNKCRIYEDRPAACKAYPHSGDFDFYKNLSLHKRNMKYCPGLMEIVKRMASL